MKTCKVCGAKNFDTEIVCEKCHTPLAINYNSNYQKPDYTPNYPPQQTANYYSRPATSRNSGLRTAAKVLMIMDTVVLGIALLCFVIFWIIGLVSTASFYYAGAESLSILSLIYILIFLPMFAVLLAMTIHYCGKIRNGEQPGIAFKVCTLIFVNRIAGILMLCDNEEGFRDR